MTTQETTASLPRIEDYRADLSPDEIRAANAANTRSIAMQAYLHAFPAFLHMRQLTEFILGRQYMAPDENPLCGWFLMRKLADTSTTTVSPNVDTLYGATYVFLDQQGPMVLCVPPVPDRYYSVAILDAYFNNFAIISPRTFGNGGGNFLLVPPGWSGDAPDGIQSVITAPTPIINLFQRIFIRSEAEYELLHGLQDAIRLVPLAQWGTSTVEFPPADLSPYDIQGMRMTRDPLKFFEYTNFYTGINPPPVEDVGLMELFKTVGLGPGSKLPDEPHLRQAIADGAADAQTAIYARITTGPFRDGWTVPDPKIGIAGPHIMSRATCQLTALGAFPPAEAIYFFSMRDGKNRPLHGSHKYTLTFPTGLLPPLHDLGFWSLTMYNESFLLVNNPIDRYIIRPDQAGLTISQEGSLTLYLQTEKPTGVPEGNWLPAPEGAFSVALRAYLPQETILNGSWFPSGLNRVD